MSKNTVVIGGVVVALAIVLVFLSQNSSKDTKDAKFLEAPDAQTSVVGSDAIDPTDSEVIAVDFSDTVPEGWQRYVNTELGFSVNYPEGWHVLDYWKDPRPSPSSFSIVGFDPWGRNPGGAEWMVTRKDATGTPEEQVTESLNDTSTDARYESTRTKIIHDGYPAVYIVSTHIETGIVSYAIVVPQGQYIYSIQATDYSQIVIEDIEIDPFGGEGGTALRDRSILFKDLSEKDYPQTFLKSFRLLK